MTAPTIVWGAVADQWGLCHWNRYERSADGRGAQRVEEWASEPTDEYASWHPSPMEARWCHGTVIGRVIALRRQHDKLFAVAELDEVTPDVLDELATRHGPLRWSASTSRVGRGPLKLRECSLTPRPASIGLAAVRWHQADVSKGDPPMWVREDVKRGQREVFHRADVLHVFDPRADDAFVRSGGGDKYRHDPREIFCSGAVGRVIAVNGRPVRGR